MKFLDRLFPPIHHPIVEDMPHINVTDKVLYGRGYEKGELPPLYPTWRDQEGFWHVLEQRDGKRREHLVAPPPDVSDQIEDSFEVRGATNSEPYEKIDALEQQIAELAGKVIASAVSTRVWSRKREITVDADIWAKLVRKTQDLEVEMMKLKAPNQGSGVRRSNELRRD